MEAYSNWLADWLSLLLMLISHMFVCLHMLMRSHYKLEWVTTLHWGKALVLSLDCHFTATAVVSEVRAHLLGVVSRLFLDFAGRV